MTQTKIGDEEIERVKARVIVDAKDELEAWAKRRLWFIGLLGVIASLVGATGVASLVLQGSIDKFQAAERDSMNKLNSELIAATAKAQLASLRVDEDMKRVQVLETNVATGLTHLQNLRTNVSAVQLAFEKVTATAPVLLPDDRRNIRIKAVPTPTGSSTAAGNQLTRLTYTVDVPDKDGARLLNAIDRVLYVLNERWFSPHEIDRRDPANHFAFTIDVWGSTEVRARVYFREGGDTMEFRGVMNRTEISYLDPA
jgi:hypothetical protein